MEGGEVVVEVTVPRDRPLRLFNLNPVHRIRLPLLRMGKFVRSGALFKCALLLVFQEVFRADRSLLLRCQR